MTQTRRQFLASVAGVTAAGSLARSGSDVSTATPFGGTATQTTSAWPMYAGDLANTGYAAETTGPTTNVGPAWEYDTGGQVTAGVAVVDGTVYVSSHAGAVSAVDADDGTERWRFEVDSEVKTTPAVVEGTLYVGTQAGLVYAVDTADGTEQWRFGTSEDITSSAAVADETVYVGSRDGTLYAIDATDGTGRWRFETEFWIRSSPAVVDGVVYTGSDDGNLYALDAESGEQLWSFPVSRQGISGSPTVVDGAVYIGGMDQRLYAVDAADGSGIWWFETGGTISAAPAVADGTVYVTSRSHDVFAIDAEEGTEQWAFDTGRQVSAAPAVADGVVYVGSESQTVFGIDAADGTERWAMETTRPVSAAPAVADETVYIGTESGTLYALEDGFASAAPVTGDSSETADDAGAGAREVPSPFEDLSYLFLPLTAAGVVTLITGGYYTLTRAGVFDSVDSASDVFGDETSEQADTAVDEPAATGTDDTVTESASADTVTATESADTAAGSQPSQLWQLVVDDVTERASESETTAIEDFVVTKHLDRETLSAPVLVYEIESVREEPARVRLTEPLVSLDGDAQPLGDSWRLADDELTFETVVDPGETVTTLVGRPDCPAERAGDLLEKPAVSVESQ